jgi:hypothetical protein
MLHRRTFSIAGAGALCAQFLPPAVKPPRAERFPENPIIRPDMPTVGDDINGPSLVRAAEWLEHPLGRYYLYFAGHRGTSIRLACADRLAGPWKVYEPGVLDLKQTACRGHIASPDVHIDNAGRQIRMYFHGPVAGDANVQRTFLAVSRDDVHFTAAREVLAADYLRLFQHGGYYYGITNGAQLHRAKDPTAPFEPGPNLFPEFPEGRVRHVALKLDGEILSLFYTRIGDKPESILFSTIHITPDWKSWKASEGTVILQPELPYEGADLPLEPSQAGPAKVRVRQLRDPAIYREGNRAYLLYSVAGESGIAIAELH